MTSSTFVRRRSQLSSLLVKLPSHWHSGNVSALSRASLLPEVIAWDRTKGDVDSQHRPTFDFQRVQCTRSTPNVTGTQPARLRSNSRKCTRHRRASGRFTNRVRRTFISPYRVY